MKPVTPLVILAVVAALFTAACGASTGPLGSVPSVQPTPDASASQGDPDLTPEPSLQPSPSETTDPTTEPTGSAAPTPSAAPAGTSIVRAYFYLGGDPRSAGLVAVLREVPQTKAVATAAMNALLDGPSSKESAERVITSAVPAGTQLLGLSIADGVATVDLSSEFESGGGSASVLNRLGQVVYTLTQFPTVDAVLFRIEGRAVTVFSSEGIVLDGPVTRQTYEALLPEIFVDRPVWGAALGNPGRITGNANVFEATFRVTLLDAAGREIADEMVMASCGTGCRGTFDVTVRYDVAKSQWGILRVWYGSAKDGSPQGVREYPVWLTRAG
jgi:spore germination protein GerM